MFEKLTLSFVDGDIFKYLFSSGFRDPDIDYPFLEWLFNEVASSKGQKS
jgi:hypothetical protein